MSVFLDIGTGKMFDTLAELKAFQRSKGEVKTSPSFLPKEQTNSVEEVKEPVKKEIKKEIKEEPTLEVGEIKKEKDETISEIKVNVPRREMIRALREKGVDGRSLRSTATDEAVAEMYIKLILGQGRTDKWR